MKKIIASAAIMPLVSLGLSAASAFADTEIKDSNVHVTNVNTAVVSSNISASASTGFNWALGGRAGNGGNGGNVNNSDDTNTGGNGGNAGDGGAGGTILTGDAVAGIQVNNSVNINDTDVGCDCESTPDEDLEVKDSETTVDNINTAVVGTEGDAKAKTGKNDTSGGEAGNAGEGGTVESSDDDNVGGKGGNTGNGGNGGVITTGWSTTLASVVNVLNQNITRIRR